MDENKEKLTGSTSEEEIHDEMEELAKVFQAELKKAKEEAEDFTKGIENIEVDGYNPQTVSRGEKSTPIPEDQLCEYCGERVRGTEKNPDSPYCSSCEELLEKYPYDYRGIIAVVLTACITVAAVFCFAINVPIFATMKQGDKAVNKGQLYTAINKYNDAVEYANNLNGEKKCYNLHKKIAEACFAIVNMNSALTEIGDNIPDAVINLLTFKDLQDILDSSERMQATAMVAQQYISKYPTVNDETYDKIIAELDALSGKKIYITEDGYHDETEKDFTPDGTETIVMVDEGWLSMYKYAAATEMDKDKKIVAKYLEECANSSEYMKTLVGSLLASTYAGIGEYDKAETLINEVREINTETPEYHMVMSLIYRYRDKDYAHANQVCDEGLKMLAGLPNGENYVMQYGYMLQLQQTLNYVMQDRIEEAYEAVTEAYDNLSMTGGLTIQVRDLYAILALATGDTECFEALDLEIDSLGDEAYAFTKDVTDYKAGKITLKEIVESGRYDLI